MDEWALVQLLMLSELPMPALLRSSRTPEKEWQSVLICDRNAAACDGPLSTQEAQSEPPAAWQP